MEQFTATLYKGEKWVEEDVATVRLTPSLKVASGNGYDEGGTYLQYLRVPRGVNKMELADALRHTMGGSSCTHAYDCCGCASRFIMTKMINTRTMQVRTKIYYNY
jgi:hypothetical protein